LKPRNITLTSDRGHLGRLLSERTVLRSAAALGAAALLLIGAAGARADKLAGSSGLAQTYTIIDMGSLGSSPTEAESVNNLGQATGSSFVSGTDKYHAFLFTPAASGGLTDLGTAGNDNSEGQGINDSGQVVGMAFTTTPTGSTSQPFLTTGGVAQPLTVTGANLTDVEAINNSGQIAGTAVTPSGAFDAVIVGPDKTVTDLGSLAHGSQGNAISPAGLVAGSSQDAQYQTHAILYTPGVGLTDLGALGGSFARGLGVNDSGQVVGYVRVDGGATHAFFASPSVPMTDLGTLGGLRSAANAINSLGQTVGEADTPDGVMHAFLSTNGGALVDLNTLIAPGSDWVLSDTTGISDTGYIVGSGIRNGMVDSFLLTPLAAAPEPSAWICLALGALGLSGLTWRARQRRA